MFTFFEAYGSKPVSRVDGRASHGEMREAVSPTWGLGFRVEGFRVLGFRVSDLGFRV